MEPLYFSNFLERSVSTNNVIIIISQDEICQLWDPEQHHVYSKSILNRKRCSLSMAQFMNVHKLFRLHDCFLAVVSSLAAGGRQPSYVWRHGGKGSINVSYAYWWSLLKVVVVTVVAFNTTAVSYHDMMVIPVCSTFNFLLKITIKLPLSSLYRTWSNKILRCWQVISAGSKRLKIQLTFNTTLDSVCGRQWSTTSDFIRSC